MGASLCVNKVALAQNLGLEYARSCRTMLDPNTVRRGGADALRTHLEGEMCDVALPVPLPSPPPASVRADTVSESSVCENRA